MDNMNMRFDLKIINFLSSIKVIVCQNENGPCPLIALANALLLQNKIFIHPDNNIITQSDLIELVANCVMENSNHQSKSLEEDTALQTQQLLNEVLTTLPTLVNGLDLNVKFSGVSDFEFTRELSVFDALNISLYHGWVVDPQDVETAEVVGHMSYNQAVNKLVECQEKQSSQNEQQQKSSTTSPIALVDMSSPYVLVDRLDLNNNNSSSNDNDNENSVVVVNEKLNEQKKPTHGKEGTEKEMKVDSTLSDGGDNHQQPHFPQTVNVSNNNTDGNNTTTTAAPDITITPSPTVASSASPVDEDDVSFNAELDLLKHKASIIQIFLTETASQFTYEGLRQLHQVMAENQLAVFFRNNHFATLFKCRACLYLLVTDLGYKNVPQVVWEKVEDISSSDFVDEHFLQFAPLLTPPSLSNNHHQQQHFKNDVAASSSLINNTNTSRSSNGTLDHAFQDSNIISPKQQQQQYHDIDNRKAELSEMMRRADKGEEIDAVRLDFLLNTVQFDNDSADVVTTGAQSSSSSSSSGSISSANVNQHIAATNASNYKKDKDKENDDDEGESKSVKLFPLAHLPASSSSSSSSCNSNFSPQKQQQQQQDPQQQEQRPLSPVHKGRVYEVNPRNQRTAAPTAPSRITLTPLAADSLQPVSSSSSLQLLPIEDDYTLAMRLQREEESGVEQEMLWEQQQREQYQQYNSQNSYHSNQQTARSNNNNNSSNAATASSSSSRPTAGKNSDDGSSCTLC